MELTECNKKISREMLEIVNRHFNWLLVKSIPSCCSEVNQKTGDSYLHITNRFYMVTDQNDLLKITRLHGYPIISMCVKLLFFKIYSLSHTSPLSIMENHPSSSFSPTSLCKSKASLICLQQHSLYGSIHLILHHFIFK